MRVQPAYTAAASELASYRETGDFRSAFGSSAQVFRPGACHRSCEKVAMGGDDSDTLRFADTGHKRVWETWPGTHRFCCNGRVMAGPDFGVTLFAAGLKTFVSAAFWLLVCPSFGAGVLAGSIVLWVLAMGFMLATSLTDPGIIPRNPFMDDAEAALQANSTRSIEIKGVTVQLKWCTTCHIWRPPRAAHCSECDVCVERFDHHCPWMGQCIGRRNYRFFIGTRAARTRAARTHAARRPRHAAVPRPRPARLRHFALYALPLRRRLLPRPAFSPRLQTAPLSLRKCTRPPPRPALRGPPTPRATSLQVVSASFERSPAACTLLIFPLLIFCCVAPLGCYHSCLVCSNRTTAEDVKGTLKPKNPFSRGCRSHH